MNRGHQAIIFGHGPCIAHDGTDAAGDLNGDGKPDLVLTDYTDDTVSVLLNEGDGTFAAEVLIPMGGAAIGLAIADVNGDGKPDLVIGLGTPALVVLVNEGGGTFATAASYPGFAASSIAVGDVNGDGRADLATGCFWAFQGTTIDVALGYGSGAFVAPFTYTVGQHPAFVALGDVNGDNRPDLVASDVASNTVSVLLNQGNGTFGGRVDYATMTSPAQVAIGDVNGDGKPDLVVGNMYGGAVQIFTNTGGGAFSAAVDVPTGPRPYAVAIADMNGDGKPDLVAVGEEVDVLLGICP